MATAVQPPPYQSPLVDENGNLSTTWAMWFRQLFVRIGGKYALSNAELNDTTAASLQAQINALSATTGGLSQEPVP